MARMMRMALESQEELEVQEASGLADAPEEIVDKEVEQQQREIAEEIDENERLMDTAEALESLVETIAQLPEDLSETDQALIRSNIAMATAGTDLQPSELVPAQESFTTRQVAMEGIMDTVKNIWNSVKISNDKLTAGIAKVFMTQLGQVSSMRKKMNDFSLQVSNLKQAGQDFQIEMSLGRAIKGENGQVTDKQSFFNSYYHDTAMLREVMQHCSQLANSFDSYMDLLVQEAKDKGETPDKINIAYKRLKEGFMTPLVRSKYFKDSGEAQAGIESFASDKLLGMKYFQATCPETDTLEGLDKAGMRSVIGGFTFRLVDQPMKAEEWQGQKVTFAALDHNEFQKFISDVTQTLDTLETFYRSSMNDLNKRRTKLPKVLAAIGIGANVAGALLTGVGTGLLTGTSPAGALGAVASIPGMKGAFATKVAVDTALNYGTGMAINWARERYNMVLRMSNTTIRLLNNTTSVTASATKDHLDLGFGVVKKVANNIGEADYIEVQLER